ncbi:MAG: hypothetical protein IPH48_15280 [bacterium]|nr:hypothetical protein [bacterium]
MFSVRIIETTYDPLPGDSAIKRVLSYALVSVSTRTPGGSWFLRAQGDLDADGSFSSNNWEQSFPCEMKVNVRLMSTGDEHVTVMTASGAIYSADTLPVSLTSGGIYVFNRVNVPNDGTNWYYAAAAFGSIQDGWTYFDAEAGEDVSNVDVYWPSGTWPMYECGPREIHLCTRDRYPWDRPVLHHEYGHHIQCREYGTIAGCNPAPDPHYVYSPSCPQFAFAEGWSEFVQCVIDNNPNNLNTNGGNIETNSWYLYDGPGGDGCITEGSIASVLWDAYDSANESGDRISLGINDLYNDVFELDEPTSAEDLHSSLVDVTDDQSDVEALFAKYGCTVCVAPSTPDVPTIAANPACSGTDVSVSWPSVTGATSYVLYRNGMQVWTGPASPATVTAVAGTYAVAALNGCGTSDPSGGRLLSVINAPAAPGTPEFSANPVCSGGAVDVTWPVSAGATRLHRLSRWNADLVRQPDDDHDLRRRRVLFRGSRQLVRDQRPGAR